MMHPENRDRELIACDFVAECAQRMVTLSAGLLASACAADPVATEAGLWAMRRALVTMIEGWRDFVPPVDTDGGAI